MLHQIGIGALGPVFRTYEPTRDRLVAVKVFRLDIVPEQAQALAAALGKAAAASLFHPSIVEPIAAGVEGTLAYRAEEYVAAESLDVAMRHYAPAAIEKVLPFITQLAGAIDFARAAGVGHGGFHPRDIFVTPDDARATGFGVIEALEEVGIRAPVRRPYTAPERIDGKSWSTPADVFSLAAITFELLTGRRPAGTGPSIGALPDGEHSPALHAVLARAMHDDPSARYPSALAFAAALESAARGDADSSTKAQIAALPQQPARTPGEFTIERELESVADTKSVVAMKHGDVEAVEARGADTEPTAPVQFVVPGEHAERDPVREPLLFDAAREDRYEEPFGDEFTLNDSESRSPYSEHLAAERANHAKPQVEPEPVEPVEPWESAMYEPPDSSRPAVLPTAIGVVLGLLAGFAGGYFVGSRDRLAPETTSASAPPSAGAPSAAAGVPATTAAAGAATRDQPGQYSEQKVNPSQPAGAAPTEPRTTEVPPVVQEGAPARSGTARETGRPAAPGGPRERAKSTGTIVVKSTPSHAGVTVNGNWRGRTPLTLDRLAFGHYVVRIVQPGYRVAQEEFTIAGRDVDHTFTAKLEPNASAAKREPAVPKSAPTAAGGFVGTLYVDSRPRGATVLLDGRNIGVTPLSLGEVPIGSHVVRVELTGKKPWTSTATVSAGQTARVTMSLEDKQ